MDGSDYDVVIMGTGITESIISGLLSLEGKKILHIDRNGYYGDSGASLNITSLWNKFLPGKEVPTELGQNRDWNIDLTPKFIMTNGTLVKMIIKTQVSHYLTWKSVTGIYVYQFKKGGMFSSDEGKIVKVPANDSEALSSDLMSLFEKRRCAKFFKFVDDFDSKNPETFKKKDPSGKKFSEFIEIFGLEANTIDFIGNSIALYTDNSFLDKPALEVIEAVKLYMDSVGRFGESPFIYPVYGLAGIPESFSRKCAVYGGTFMLNVEIKNIEQTKSGIKVTGVYEGKEGYVTAKCVVTHPSYIQRIGMGSRLGKSFTALRIICIIDHLIAHTKNSPSVQIIIPSKQTGRKSNIYIMMMGSEHGVCKKGYNLAIISTMKEKENIDEDVSLAYEIIGAIKYKFVQEEEMLYPLDKSPKDGIFITKTLDHTSHFETAGKDVLEIYKAMTGKDLDLTITEEESKKG